MRKKNIGIFLIFIISIVLTSFYHTKPALIDNSRDNTILLISKQVTSENLTIDRLEDGKKTVIVIEQHLELPTKIDFEIKKQCSKKIEKFFYDLENRANGILKRYKMRVLRI